MLVMLEIYTMCCYLAHKRDGSLLQFHLTIQKAKLNILQL